MTRIANVSISLGILLLSLIQISTASAYPQAAANGPYVGYYGMPSLYLYGEGTTPDSSSPITGYEWKVLTTGSVLANFGQTIVPWSTIQPSIAQNPLPYMMPLLFTVTDSSNNFDTDYTTLTIYDRRPFAVANWYGDPYLGEPLILDGSDSYHGMPSHTLELYSWQVIGTSLSWSSEHPTYSLGYNEYSQFLLLDPVTGLYGEGKLKLTVTDDLGQTNSREFVIKPAVSIPNPVPEPATMLLLASGLVGLAGFRKRFRKR